MRKALSILAVAIAAAIAAPATSHAARYHYRASANTPAELSAGAAGYRFNPVPGEVTAGVVTGTVVGLGVSEGWWGATAAGVALPTTAAGAAAVGGVAGIGALALADAIVQPCRGFHAMFMLNRGACVNGHYVGYGPHRVVRR